MGFWGKCDMSESSQPTHDGKCGRGKKKKKALLLKAIKILILQQNLPYTG